MLRLIFLTALHPCPPFSMSGTKQKGWGKEKMAYGFKQERIEDLTFEQVRIVGELQPKVVVVKMSRV